MNLFTLEEGRRLIRNVSYKYKDPDTRKEPKQDYKSLKMQLWDFFCLGFTPSESQVFILRHRRLVCALLSRNVSFLFFRDYVS